MTDTATLQAYLAEAEAALLEAHEILTAAVSADHPQTQKVIPDLLPGAFYR